MTPDQLAKLHAKTFSTPRPWTAEEFASLLSSHGVFLSELPQGFALGRVVVDEAELLTLSVEPKFQNMGYGAMLLNYFEGTARDRRAQTAFLEVAETNLQPGDFTKHVVTKPPRDVRPISLNPVHYLLTHWSWQNLCIPSRLNS